MSERLIEVRVPDIGDFDEVEIVEVLVESGDGIEADDPLVTLESDKASMDLPAPAAGRISEVKVTVGDMVSEGSLVVTIEGAAEEEEEGEAEGESEEKPQEKPERRGEPEDRDDEERRERERRKVPRPVEPPPQEAEEPPPTPEAITPPTEAGTEAESPAELPHASPSVRRFARELGVDLRRVEGSGRKGRILEEDVKAFVKETVAEPAARRPAEERGIPAVPEVDFSKFGEVEEVSLSRIRRRAKENVYRSWLNVPHVTQHDAADVTELEAFRRQHAGEAEERGFKLTPLAFVMKATVGALREFPRLNASLGASGETLILKRYYHLGVAVDTEDGLVVPVVRDVDRKGIFELAEELAAVSGRAREGKLQMKDFQGASFTISSLGGIGGTAFTPIVNAPEVAILGVSRHRREPVWRDGEFVPRLMLPLSLSYDHRVVDGAEAVRFTTHLAELLGDIRRLLL